MTSPTNWLLEDEPQPDEEPTEEELRNRRGIRIFAAILGALVVIGIIAEALQLGGIPYLITLVVNTLEGIGAMTAVAMYYGLMLVYPLATIAIHELAHVLTGVLLGYRPRFIGIGPYFVERGEGRWHFRKTGVHAGFAIVYPRSAKNIVVKEVIVLAAGPLASVLSAVPVAVVMIKLIDLWGVESALVLMLFFIAWAAFLLIAVLIPLPGSDIRKIFQLLAGGPKADRMVAMLLTTAANDAGIRPREWDGELLAKATQNDDLAPENILPLGFAYAYALDSNDIAQAAQYIDRLSDYLDHPYVNEVEVLKHMLINDIASFEARYRSDVAKARHLLDQVPVGEAFEEYRLMAEAELLLAEGEHELASQKASAALEKWHEHTRRTGTDIAALERLEDLIALAEAK